MGVLAAEDAMFGRALSYSSTKRASNPQNEDGRNMLLVRNFACVTYSIQEGKENEESEN